MNDVDAHRPDKRSFWAMALTALASLLCAAALTLPLMAEAAPLTVGSAMPPVRSIFASKYHETLIFIERRR